MANDNFFLKKRILILGGGISGVATWEYLRPRSKDLFLYEDSQKRRDVLEAQGIALLKDISLELVATFDMVVISPGINWRWPRPHRIVKMARSLGTPIYSDLDIAMIHSRRSKLHSKARQPFYIGITGSNGKSTAVSLLHHILQNLGIKSLLCGNIGVPLIGVLDEAEQVDVVILELSSYQLETSRSLFLGSATILNIAPDHLERHLDMNGYISAKERIFDSCPQPVLNVDIPSLEALKHLFAPNYISVSTTDETADIFCNGTRLCDNKDKITFDIPNSISNIVMASCYAFTKLFVAEGGKIIEAASSFKSLPHRQEYIGSLGLARVINDSKATNTAAARHALKSYENVIWLAGGMLKGDLAELDDALAHVDHAFLFGRDGEIIAKYLEKKHIPRQSFAKLEEAFVAAADKAASSNQPLSIVLSPGGASFDEFHDFSHRGECFKQMYDNYLVKLKSFE